MTSTFASILPAPRRVAIDAGVLDVAEPLTVVVAPDADRRASRAVQAALRSFSMQLRIAEQSTTGCVNVACRRPNSETESYSLQVRPDGVELNADGPAGVFYGLQTLSQLARSHDRRWPCVTIEDSPDLPVRGLSLDVSRGKVPKLETLKSLVDRLAAWKINHLQLYVEHTFDFSFDASIAEGCSPLTADEITFLDAYCTERFIDLVPSLAVFGHMGRILNLPQYRRLAEIECHQPWESQPWSQRMRGLTLNARDPKALALIERMLAEYLPLFSSRLVNVNCDETHDLGRGKNEDYCRQVGRGRHYVDHLRFLHSLCERHGKRMLFWSDVIRNHPDLICDVPPDAVMLDWGYEIDSEFPAVASPYRASRDVFVCPGTSGWNRLINAQHIADTNIANATDAARQHNATGMIVTDWGDHGHFNLLDVSMPAIALAAARAWNAHTPDPELDRAVEIACFGQDSVGRLSMLRRLSRLTTGSHTWCALYSSLNTPDPTTPDDPNHESELSQAAGNAVELFAECGSEWRIAVDAVAVLAEKTAVDRRLRVGRLKKGDADAFAAQLAEFRDGYTDVWLQRNKPNRLRDVTRVLDDVIADLRS